MVKNIEGEIKESNYRIHIVASKFNKVIVDRLIEGAIAALRENNVKEENITIVYVPGAFEIPVVVKKLCRKNLDKNELDGIITLGCIIKGETAHFEYVSSPVSHSLNHLSHQYEIPIGFGVLTCYDPQQANERSLINPPTIENNKGYESAMVVLEMIDVLKKT
ncbi:MAG: 6,7-dimethyl-8-ribityllumazine synthase [Ignavibacteria bacterium]|nr:6,7-dimethyl-8-ribityllumazine synthase [Ignavibacteria bacterium]